MQGFKDDMIEVERYLNLRYDGTDVAMMTQSKEGQSYAEVATGQISILSPLQM